MLLSVESLKLSINNIPILDGVHLSLNEGEIHGFLGPNGAGKSTTINAILGLLKADSGHIKIFGKEAATDVEGRMIRKQTGVLPEQNGFYEWMTAANYLEFFSSLYGHSINKEKIQEGLHRVGLDPKNGQIIGTFSHGMKQRLGLARALVSNPRLIILDEPTNGLDPRGRRDIHDLLLSLAAKGAGILLCTHLLDDVERLCSSVGVIVDGRTIADGAVNDLLRNTENVNNFRLRVTSPPSAKELLNLTENVLLISHDDEWYHLHIDTGTPPETVWQQLFDRGWKIAEIHRERGGVEDMYLSLTEGKIS